MVLLEEREISLFSCLLRIVADGSLVHAENLAESGDREIDVIASAEVLQMECDAQEARVSSEIGFLNLSGLSRAILSA